MALNHKGKETVISHAKNLLETDSVVNNYIYKNNNKKIKYKLIKF